MLETVVVKKLMKRLPTLASDSASGRRTLW